MMRIGLYMNDLGLHDTSREMVLSGIKPLPQLEMARDHVSFWDSCKLSLGKQTNKQFHHPPQAAKQPNIVQNVHLHGSV